MNPITGSLIILYFNYFDVCEMNFCVAAVYG